ncbi:DNA polymerase eta [Nymphon striatum]|nr:DNA polymerase eta [Nymphon striatum]
MEKIRLAILEQTQYKCSAGIAHNKIIAKLCCGLNKPNKQTIVPHSSIPHLYSSIPVKKVRGFGGKFGDDVMEKLGVTMMSDLETFSENFLKSKFGDKSGKWLYDISRGFEYEEVCARLLPKSLGCSKNFMGKSALKSKEQVKCWYKTLSMELEERLTKDKQNNKRVAKHLTVGMVTLDESKRRVVVTRSLPILSYSVSKLHVDAFQSLSKVNIAPKNSDDWYKNTAHLIKIILSIAIATAHVERLMSFVKRAFGDWRHRLHVDTLEHLIRVSAEGVPPEEFDTRSVFLQWKSSDDFKYSDINLSCRMPPVINVCMTAGKFEDDSGTNCSSIKNFFLPSTSQTLNHNRTRKEVNSAENELKTNEVPNEPQNHDSIDKSQEMINFLANELGNLSEKSESSTSENSKSCNQFTSPSKLSENNIKDRQNIKSGKNKNLLKDMLEKARSKEISYKSCELTVNSIDSDVLENLPADIRQEILQHLENSGGQDNANHLDDNQHQKCDKCGENVKISQLTEHLDFHLAKELSREMNSTSSTSMSTHFIDSKPGKRSLQPKGNQNKKAKVNCKKINSYFK